MALEPLPGVFYAIYNPIVVWILTHNCRFDILAGIKIIHHLRMQIAGIISHVLLLLQIVLFKEVITAEGVYANASIILRCYKANF